MPAAPDVDFLTRFVFENPWPISLFIALLAPILAWTAMRDRSRRRFVMAVLLFLAAVLLFCTGFLVTTSGEESQRVVREFVNATIENRRSDCLAMLHDDATLVVGPGVSMALPRSVIERQLTIVSRFSLSGVTVTSINGYTESDEFATVHLRISVKTEAYGGIPGSFVLRCRRDDDGEMRIERITVISVARLSENELGRRLTR